MVARLEVHNMKPLSFLVMIFLSMSTAYTIPLEEKATKLELAISGGGNKGARNLIASTDQLSEGKSSRFFGGMPPFMNPTGGFFPTPGGGYNMGVLPSYPYFSPYGYGNGPMNPMNYGGFYPINPGFYGNRFGGYSTTQQQQQQQQVSQIGAAGTGIGGFNPSFSG